MENFTPVSAFIGGMMIGVAAVLLMLLQGRIAGISGILGGLLQPKHGEFAWRLAFVAGLIAAPVTYRFISGAGIAVEIPASSFLLIAGGLLVGFGTRLGVIRHRLGAGRVLPRPCDYRSWIGYVADIAVFYRYAYRHGGS